MKRLLGFLAMAGLVLLAVPVERAQAVSLINPAAAAQTKYLSDNLTVEVRHRGGGFRGGFRGGGHRHFGHRHFGGTGISGIAMSISTAHTSTGGTMSGAHIMWPSPGCIAAWFTPTSARPDLRHRPWWV